MKFSNRQDIDAPIALVFENATDFPRFEKQARRRGADVRRLDKLAEPAIGVRWVASFTFRGKLRRVQAELAAIAPPERLRLTSVSGGVRADFEIELMALSHNRTRIRAGLDLRPVTLAARLLIQSLKFAKSNLDRRFAERMVEFARDVELKHDPMKEMHR